MEDVTFSKQTGDEENQQISRQDSVKHLGGGYRGVLLGMIMSQVAGLAHLRRAGLWTDSPDEIGERVADLPIDVGGKQKFQTLRRLAAAELASWRDSTDRLLRFAAEVLGLNWSRETIIRQAIRASDDPSARISIGYANPGH